MHTAKTLAKAFTIGAIIGAIIGPTTAIALAHYGWETIAAGRTPIWARNHRQTPHRRAH